MEDLGPDLSPELLTPSCASPVLEGREGRQGEPGPAVFKRTGVIFITRQLFTVFFCLCFVLAKVDSVSPTLKPAEPGVGPRLRGDVACPGWEGTNPPSYSSSRGAAMNELFHCHFHGDTG